MSHYSYTALRFTQRDGRELLTFVAPVGEIKLWAGIPRKHFNYQHGFQRSLLDKRVMDLREFYDQDEQNFTPTAVVVAIRKGAIKLTDTTVVDASGRSLAEGLCNIEFDIEDFESKGTSELIERALQLLRNRLSPEAIAHVEQDFEKALEATAEAEASDDAQQLDDEAGSGDLETPPDSHLFHFFAELFAINNGTKPVEDDTKSLRENN